MQNLQKLNLAQLVDLLNKGMTRYYTLIADASLKKEFNDCKATIKEIQKEIQTRKKKMPK